MAQTIGGIAGAAIGFAIGGPAGAQWGWAIGAAVGTSFTTIKTPRIGDLAEIRAGEGGPRARTYGRFRPIGGQVVWAGKPREIRTRQRQGKGGPKVETSTILRSYAIGICEGPIVGVSRIWRNNELVYDVRPGSAILAESARWIQGKTILTGTWTQGVHPTIEAEAGPANAPAMRGTALLVVTDEDLTDLRGAIPSYQFEVGSSQSGASYAFLDGDAASAYGTQLWAASGADEPVYHPNPAFNVIPSTAQSAVCIGIHFDQGRPFENYVYRITRNGGQVFPDFSVSLDQKKTFAISVQPGDVIQGFGLEPSIGRANDYLSVRWSPNPLSAFVSAFGAEFVQQGGLEPTLRNIVRSICSDSGLSAEKFSVDDLPEVMVSGFATSPDYSAAEAIRELAKVYFFDIQDADGRVKFVSRGGNFAAIITEDQFVDGEDEPESDTTRDSLSVPRLLHLSYFDIDGGQGADKQFSERQVSPRAEAPTVLQTPVVLTAATAARAISVQHQVAEEELRGELVFGVSDQLVRLATADVVVIQYRGRSQRCRVTKVEIMDGWQRITAVRDRQSAYSATVQPVPSAPVTPPPSTIPGATRFAFLDLPALSQAGDALGYHVASSGETASWRGAVIEREEAGAQFLPVATDGAGTVMGTLTAAVPATSELYPDETTAITVLLARTTDDLAAVSREVWLSRGNAAALVRADGSAEIVQFREAVETTPGTWRLTGLLRGRLNTGASAHSIGAVFVLLEGALFVAAPSERIGTTLTHRAWSVGNDATTATTQTRNWTARSQREWPPVIDTASRAGDTLTVAWTPRHRFGGEQAPVASSHFDGWRIEAASGATTVAIDAPTTATSAALAVAGMPNPITVTVRARNRLAGLGDPATRILP